LFTVIDDLWNLWRCLFKIIGKQCFLKLMPLPQTEQSLVSHIKCKCPLLLHPRLQHPGKLSINSFSYFTQPIAVTTRSEARTVFAHTNTEIVGSNPTRGMDVCVFCVH
jgi:hypothetical protein